MAWLLNRPFLCNKWAISMSTTYCRFSGQKYKQLWPRAIIKIIQMVKIINYVSIQLTRINFIKLYLTNFWNKKKGLNSLSVTILATGFKSRGQIVDRTNLLVLLLENKSLVIERVRFLNHQKMVKIKAKPRIVEIASKLIQGKMAINVQYSAKHIKANLT